MIAFQSYVVKKLMRVSTGDAQFHPEHRRSKRTGPKLITCVAVEEVTPQALT